MENPNQTIFLFELCGCAILHLERNLDRASLTRTQIGDEGRDCP